MSSGVNSGLDDVAWNAFERFLNVEGQSKPASEVQVAMPAFACSVTHTSALVDM